VTAPGTAVFDPAAHASATFDQLAEALGLGPAEVAAARTACGSSGTRLLRELARRVGLDAAQHAFFDVFGVASVDLEGHRVPAGAAAWLPAALSEQGLAACIGLDPDGTLVVGVSHPFDYALGRQLARLLEGRPARFVRVAAAQLRTLAVAPDPSDDGAFAHLVSTEVEAQVAAEQANAPDDVDRAPRVGEQLVEQLFERAVAARATDVHLDPYRDVETGTEGLRVRFRVDGAARRQPDLCLPGGSGLRTADIVARTMRIAGGATALSSTTQDFRIYREVAGAQVCGRVHTRPAFLGGTGRAATAQKTSIRILDGRIRRLEDLGLSAHVLDAWRHAATTSGRLCLVSGPTGSGKTTLLAATIPAIVDEEEVAYSIEDPVEYHQPLLSQLEVQASSREQRRAHMTELLYDLMREDPDFVMVGEIRDRDSMELAFELALRGAQVVTTMHAGSAVHSVQRLLEWGLDPFVVATTLGAVLNVRLLRRLCPACRVPVGPAGADARWPGVLFGRDLSPTGFTRADEGCAACRGTGTVGQFTIAELLTLDGATLAPASDSADSTHTDRLSSLMTGRRTLHDEAVDALCAGDTDLVAVLRAHLGPANDNDAQPAT
jgi:type II secretory ATPase GspE/PulE/Tfp pilus assembly ATPase PilB-like protein